MKTLIRRLDSLTHNDTTATKLINDNFEALQQGIEDALSRSGKTPNYMDAELDMNMRRIINGGYPINNTDMATKEYVDDVLTNGLDVYSKEETDDLLSAKQDKLIFDNTPTPNSLNPVTSGGIYEAIQAMDFGQCIMQSDFDITETGTISDPDTDITIYASVAGLGVEDGKDYFPIYISRVYTEKLGEMIRYDKDTKRISVNARHKQGVLTNYTGTLILIPADNFASVPIIRGFTNGLIKSSIGAETNANVLTSASIASAVDSSSTNDETVGAKLFYDTCGDIETLINAL